MNRPALMATLIATALAAGGAVTPRSPPLAVLNLSASEPEGLYWRQATAPDVGRKIAFEIPGPGRDYARQVMPARLREGVLKTIVAGPGDAACVERGRLSINGRFLGLARSLDRRGRPLPQWRACRALRPGEWFVFSDRISNSFDSRYYGPVQASDVIGVYRRIGERRPS